MSLKIIKSFPNLVRVLKLISNNKYQKLVLVPSVDDILPINICVNNYKFKKKRNLLINKMIKK